MDNHIKFLFSKLDTNKNNIMDEEELEVARKKYPNIGNYLNGVQAGQMIGEIGDLVNFKTKSPLPKIQSDSDIFKKDETFPYPNDWDKKHENTKPLTSLNELPLRPPTKTRDARGLDISGLDLSEKELLDMCIDKTTKMSPAQQKLLDEHTEKMKDPGLGIKKLHAQGITGAGVKIAIIDQPLGMHREYESNLIHHEVVGANPPEAELHGAAVASIAVGKEVGVAPDADLLYFSTATSSSDPKKFEEYENNINEENKKLSDTLIEFDKVLEELEKTGQLPDDLPMLHIFPFKPTTPNNKAKTIEEYKEYISNAKIDVPRKIARNNTRLNNFKEQGRCVDNSYYAESIKKVLDMNEKLPPEKRIPVISISWGFDNLAPGYDELQKQLARAQEQGVFICSVKELADLNVTGADRDPQKDPNDPNSYQAGTFYREDTEPRKEALTGRAIPATRNIEKGSKQSNPLLIPMDHKTVADWIDAENYRYDGNDGGMSWATPHFAAIYALAKQVAPTITQEEFLTLARATATDCHNNDTETYVGQLIAPENLIKELQNKSKEPKAYKKLLEKGKNI